MFVQAETWTNLPTPNGNRTKQLWVKEAWKIPPSNWQALRHPQAEQVAREVNAYFLEHRKFPNESARAAFMKAGFSSFICLNFPLAKDDRIHIACRLLTALFLIDGMMTHISLIRPAMTMR